MSGWLIGTVCTQISKRMDYIRMLEKEYKDARMKEIVLGKEKARFTESRAIRHQIEYKLRAVFKIQSAYNRENRTEQIHEIEDILKNNPVGFEQTNQIVSKIEGRIEYLKRESSAQRRIRDAEDIAKYIKQYQESRKLVTKVPELVLPQESEEEENGAT